jgi:hypothetical protein
MNRGTCVRLLRPDAIACCAWLLLQATQVRAQATLAADVGLEHSDNVTRLATDEQSESVGLAHLALGYDVARPRLEGRIGADVSYRHYLDNTYDDDVLGGANALLNWSIVPERLLWWVEDNYGQVAADRRLPDTPANREDFNYFSTGPDLILPIGARTEVQVSGRWSAGYYGTSIQSSQNTEGRLGLARLLSESNSVSINASVENIEYDEELLGKYRITEGYARFEGTGARTTLSLDAGYTEAEHGEDTSSGPLLRLELSREITSRTTFSLSGGTEFADTALAFRISQDSAGVGPQNQDAIPATDAFRLTYAYLGLHTTRERTEYGITAYGHKEGHETTAELDRRRVGVGLNWTRQLSARMDLSVRGDYGKERFDVDDFTSDEWSAGAALGWRLTSNVSLRLSVDHFVGTGDGELRDYEENRAYVGVRYTRGRRSGD